MPRLGAARLEPNVNAVMPPVRPTLWVAVTSCGAENVIEHPGSGLALPDPTLSPDVDVSCAREMAMLRAAGQNAPVPTSKRRPFVPECCNFERPASEVRSGRVYWGLRRPDLALAAWRQAQATFTWGTEMQDEWERLPLSIAEAALATGDSASARRATVGNARTLEGRAERFSRPPPSPRAAQEPPIWNFTLTQEGRS